MSNLARTQADWTKLLREEGVHLAAVKELRDLERKFDLKRNRTQIREENSLPNNFTSLWVLNGVKLGANVGASTGNTDDDGLLYVRITDETPGAGQATIDVYKATGGGAGNKVATGNGADGATITLTASNSSGITGTVKITTVTASESNDAHRLRVFQDYPLRILNLCDGSEPEHGDERAAFNAACVTAQARVRDAIATFKSAYLAFVLGRLANFQKSSQASPMVATPKNDNGLITIDYQGVLEDTRKNMVDEATGGAQTVKGSAPSAGAGVFDSGNQGKGVMSAPSVEEWSADGVVTLQCIDDTVGSEKFAVSQKVTTTLEVRNALNPLQVNRLYADPNVGIRAALLTRTYVLATGSSNDFATAADFAITGETPTNTNAGFLYLRVVKGTIDITKWKIQFFKNNTYISAAQVGESNEAAASTASVAINPKNSSNLGGTCKIGSAPTDQNTGSLNMQTFQRQNSGTPAVADKFTVTITAPNSARGEYQDRLDELYKYRHNSTTGTPTVFDNLITAGTFSPYSVRDA